jgi:DNA-binding NarL/FixJ family response regulator
MEVVGEAGDGLEAIARARETMPDTILMDISMPECDGLTATRRIKSEMPHIDIVMLTVSEDDQDLFEAIKSGAKGYLLKDLEPSELFDLLDSISEGGAPLSGTMAAKILEEFTQPSESIVEMPGDDNELSSREVEVLELVAEGKTTGRLGRRSLFQRTRSKSTYGTSWRSCTCGTASRRPYTPCVRDSWTTFADPAADLADRCLEHIVR